MKKRSGGQSTVEMAFVLPVLLLVLFGIIDMGYYVYGYATVAQAARNAAEAASRLPPYQEWLDREGSPDFGADPCINTIRVEAAEDATLFPDIGNFVQVSYPNGGQTRNLSDRGPIEISINYRFRLLTPLSDLIGFSNGGEIQAQATVRRSLESLGNNPDFFNGIACAQRPEDIDNNRR